jgi:hypothetical protein
MISEPLGVVSGAPIGQFWHVAGSAGYQLPDGEQEIFNLGSHWGVGFHNSAKLPTEEIVEIDGIPFVFDMSSSSKRLHGAQLDYANGYFVVEENAI